MAELPARLIFSLIVDRRLAHIGMTDVSPSALLPRVHVRLAAWQALSRPPLLAPSSGLFSLFGVFSDSPLLLGYSFPSEPTYTCSHVYSPSLT